MSDPNTKKSEEQTIKQCLAGDAHAFGNLVRRYQDRLFHSMVLLTGDETESEDVVQDAFVQAYTKLSSFRQNSSFYTWLYRIAFNTAISRRRKKRPVLSVDVNRDTYGGEPLDEGDAPSDNLERTEQAKKVNQALNQLSFEHRRILILREIEGFCYETISETLGLAIGTVRSRLHRARSQMRVELEKLTQESS